MESTSLDPSIGPRAFSVRKPIAVLRAFASDFTPEAMESRASAWFREAKASESTEVCPFSQEQLVDLHPRDLDLAEDKQIYTREGFARYANYQASLGVKFITSPVTRQFMPRETVEFLHPATYKKAQDALLQQRLAAMMPILGALCGLIGAIAGGVYGAFGKLAGQPNSGYLLAGSSLCAVAANVGASAVYAEAPDVDASCIISMVPYTELLHPVVLKRGNGRYLFDYDQLRAYHDRVLKDFFEDRPFDGTQLFRAPLYRRSAWERLADAAWTPWRRSDVSFPRGWFT